MILLFWLNLFGQYILFYIKETNLDIYLELLKTTTVTAVTTVVAAITVTTVTPVTTET